MMSYNLTDPNKLPPQLPIADSAILVGNMNGQSSFVEIPAENQANLITIQNGTLALSELNTSQASGQYQFLTVNSDNNFSLQNLNITIDTDSGLSGSNINSSNLSTTIFLKDQQGILTNEVSFEGNVGSFSMTVNNQGIITAFSSSILTPERIAEKQAIKAAKKQELEERLSQLESLLQELENAII